MRKTIFAILNFLFLGSDPVAAKTFDVLSRRSKAVKAKEDMYKAQERLNKARLKVNNALDDKTAFVLEYRAAKKDLDNALDPDFI